MLVFIIMCKLLHMSSSVFDGAEYVTYSSVMKLFNEPYQVRLFSGVNFIYGGENNQQSVTAQQPQDDDNSLWIVEKVQGPTLRGVAVQCNDLIKLRHLNTDKTLRSLQIQSPLTHQQLVSAHTDHDPADTSDHWIVECPRSRDLQWVRTSSIRLRHSDTGAYLAVSGVYYQYPVSLQGHLEVVTTFLDGRDLWTAEEGVFFKKPMHGWGMYHSEL